ncbi:MAG TPA: diguanylate cyclase, partial [Geminicoccaceae bacterium]|nr:diguanylate cyclase [Geminicoccaceae bacterium]
MGRVVAFALVGALVSLIYLGGALDFVERHLYDLRSGLWPRPASGELVVVAIDPHSLDRLDVWPWPRRYHAAVIERLLEAGAARVAVDIDFSSRSTPEEDRRLAEALAEAGPGRVALPVFYQFRHAADGDGAVEVSATRPLEPFRDHAALASINVQPDSDGLVRRLDGYQEWADGAVPSMPVWLLGGTAAAASAPAPGRFLIDFGIDPRGVPRLSYVDVLTGAFDPAAVAGKRVLIGATAVELGDQMSAPRHKVLAGPLLQALAFETLIQDRALRHLGGRPVALAAMLACLAVGPLFARLSWRGGLPLLLGLSLAVAGLAGLLQPWAAVALDSSPVVLGLWLSFCAALLNRVERQARLLLRQSGILRRTDAVMRRVVDNSFDGIVTFDGRGVVESYNRAAAAMFGHPAAEMVGGPVSRLLPTAGDAAAIAALAGAGGGPCELVAARRDGGRFPVEVAFSAMELDGRRLYIAAMRDVTDRRAQRDQLERLALHDALTGLPNRTLLFDRIDHAVRRAERDGQPLALLLLDLNRFKEVNDTLGHHMGDLLLQQVGRRLQTPLRASDTLARLGGDEFAVLLPAPTDLATACAVAERMVEALSRPFEIDGLTLEVGVSIGVAVYPEHGRQVSELIQHADVAMYAAKRNQQGFAVYRPEDDTHSVRHLTLNGELRRAIEEDQLVLHYQPKVEAATGRLAGVEVLVRWEHPEHGFMPPDEFIHHAEQTGLIRPLTLWVLNAALRQHGAWRLAGYDLPVAVNLSVKSLHDAELPDIVRLLTRSWEVAPDRVGLEITESALM